jgi:hypothetical protein
MDTSRMSQSQMVAGGGGAFLIIFMFLPWFGAEGTNFSGWEAQSATDVYFLITGLVAIGLALTAGEGPSLPGTTLSGVTATLGLVAAFLTIWLIFDTPSITDAKIGLFLSVIASIAIGLGGLRSAREEMLQHYGPDDRYGQ